jgi:molybdate transport system substrate-binding protein
MMRTVRLLAGVFALVTGLSAAVSAAEVSVMATGSMRGVFQEVAPAFEAASGHKLKIDYANPDASVKKVDAGDEIDVVILAKPFVDKLVREAKIVGGTAKTLARAQLGVAVKKGAPKPDISSIEALKKTLLNAKSVAYPDVAGRQTSETQIINKLGIAAELKPKNKYVSADAAQANVGELVQRGEAEIGIQPIPRLMQVQGIDIVGPLPAELQDANLVWVAGSPFFSEQPLAAKALIDFLAGPKAAAVYKAKGFHPG